MNPKHPDLHRCFEATFSRHAGEEFSREQIISMLQEAFPTIPIGSCVPTDHAEPSSERVNQCKKCSENDYQIFDTSVEGGRKRGISRYRVRDYKPYPYTRKVSPS